MAIYTIPSLASQLTVLRAVFVILGATLGLMGIVGGVVYVIIFCFFSHDLYSFFQPLSFWIFAVFFAIFTISIIIVTVYNHVKGNPVIENISE